LFPFLLLSLNNQLIVIMESNLKKVYEVPSAFVLKMDSEGGVCLSQDQTNTSRSSYVSEDEDVWY